MRYFSTPQRLGFLAAFAIGLLLIFSGCNDGQASSEPGENAPARQSTRVETLQLQPTTFTDVIQLTGEVEALDDATLSAQASGTVEYVAERGTFVEAGGIVARLDSDEEQAAVAQAQAQYDLAQDRFERQEPLYRDSIISALEFEQVRSERNQAQAALNQAEKRLANTRIRSPFSGTVEERFVEVGEQASPGVRIARVVNTRRVKITAGVPERYANDIERGTPVGIDFGSYGMEPQEANVTFVGSTIDPETRTFPIEVEVRNPNGTLKPEMTGRVRVTRSTLDDAIVIPRAAIVRDETGTHAYVVNRTDSTATAQKTTIDLGPTYAERAVVESGLDVGDEVIVAGQNSLAPNDPVTVAQQYNSIDRAGTPIEGATPVDAGGDQTTAPTPSQPDTDGDAPASGTSESR